SFPTAFASRSSTAIRLRASSSEDAAGGMACKLAESVSTMTEGLGRSAADGCEISVTFAAGVAADGNGVGTGRCRSFRSLMVALWSGGGGAGLGVYHAAFHLPKLRFGGRPP